MREETKKQRDSMSHEEKKAWLFKEQKETLNRFLEHGAISREQYDKSLHDLIQKMDVQNQ